MHHSERPPLAQPFNRMTLPQPDKPDTRQEPAASRSSVVVCSPNGSGVTPRIQSSSRSASTVEEGRVRPVGLRRKVRVVAFLPAAADLELVLLQGSPAGQGDEGLVGILLEDQRGHAGSPDVGGLVRPAVGDEPKRPVVVPGLGRQPAHRAKALVLPSRKPSPASNTGRCRSFAGRPRAAAPPRQSRVDRARAPSGTLLAPPERRNLRWRRLSIPVKRRSRRASRSQGRGRGPPGPD